MKWEFEVRVPIAGKTRYIIKHWVADGAERKREFDELSDALQHIGHVVRGTSERVPPPTKAKEEA